MGCQLQRLHLRPLEDVSVRGVRPKAVNDVPRRHVRLGPLPRGQCTPQVPEEIIARSEQAVRHVDLPGRHGLSGGVNVKYARHCIGAQMMPHIAFNRQTQAAMH